MKQQQRLLNKSLGIFLVVLIFLLLAVSVLGDCPPGQTDNLCFDPGNPALFDYVNGDYSTITDAGWETFVQSNVPVSRVSEIPADKLKYTDLDAQQRKAMTAGQIAKNFGNIFDIANDVNSNNAEKAITQMYHQTVDLSKAVGKERVSLREDGVLATEFEGKDKVGKTFFNENFVHLTSSEFRSGRLVVTGDGFINFIPSSKEIRIPQKGLFRVDITQGSKTYQGLTMSGGFLSVSRTSVYVASEKSLQVGRLVIEGAILDGTTLFFDGRPHPDASESYVSLNKDERKLAMNLRYNSVYFLPGNPFLNVEKGDKVKISAPENGGDVEIDSLSAEYKGKILPQIPEMRIKAYGGDIVVENGPNTFTFRDSKFFQRLNDNFRQVGSSAFTIINNFDVKKERRVIMDETNHYLALPVGVYSPLYETPAGTIDLTQNARLKHDASVVFRRNSDAKVIQLGEMTDAFGKMAYNPESGTFGKTDSDVDPLVLIELSQALREMPLALKGKTNTIVVYQDVKKLQEFCGADADACAVTDRNKVFLHLSGLSNEIIYHEFAHNAFRTREQQFKWDNIAMLPGGESPYGKNLEPNGGEKKAQSELANTWADGTDEPRNGCVRSYGCNNNHEDFATHIECAVQGSECWFHLLSPDSNPWHEIHRKKFAFQCERKLIEASTCKKMGVK